MCATAALFLIGSSAAAQDEQWLQYRFGQDIARVTGGSVSMFIEIKQDKPAGAELPAFKSKQPMFGRWRSPMAKNGAVLLALDRNAKYGPYNLLYVDLDGDGNLADETVLVARSTDRYQTRFSPAKVILDGEDGPVGYHLNFTAARYEDNSDQLYVSGGCWYEGDVKVDGVSKHCILIDYWPNGTFNDKSMKFFECDRLRIGDKDAKTEPVLVGDFVQIDGKLYELDVARDGAYVRIRPTKDIACGSIKVPETITELTAGGRMGQIAVSIEKGVGKLPTGEHRVHHWTIERKDEKGNTWQLKGSNSSDEGLFKITQDQTTSLAVGEPIISTLELYKQQDQYSFRQKLAGEMTGNIEVLRNGKRADPPKLHIRSKDGTYDQVYSFAYG